MKRSGYIYILCLVLLCAAGCKSKRYAGQKASGKKMSVEQLLEAVHANEPRFDHAQAGKISVTLTYQERKMTFGGSISMSGDTLAVLSVQPLLGIELFRAELRKDSALLVDKMNRRYAVVPLSYGSLGDTQLRRAVQDMVSNRLFTLGNAELLEPKRADMQQTDTHYQLAFADPEYESLQYAYQIDAQTFRITEAQLALAGSAANMRVTYGDMRLADDILFPHALDFDITAPDGQNLTCNIALLRLSFRENVNIAPANVKRYKQIEWTDLLKK